MGDGFQLIELLFFAMIAGFLLYRLKSVLGRRHGEERQRPNPFASSPGTETNDNVVSLPDRGRTEGKDAALREQEENPLASGLEAIRAADPGFDVKGFLGGAEAAFGMIVDAFARGDTAALRPLLNDDVYDSFAAAINARQKAGETHETKLEGVRDVDLLEARLEARTAVITVKFVSDQMNVTRGADGTVLDGDPDRIVEVTDIWTFSRNTRSKDPNWLLVETGTPN